VLLLQLLVDGLQLGALYALMAVGFAVIFGSTRIFHYAHGTTYILVGYLFYWLSDRLHVPWWLAAPLAAAAAVVFGVALDRFVYRPIQRDEGSFFTVFVASFGIGVIAENLVVIFFGASFRVDLDAADPSDRHRRRIVISWLGILSMLISVLLFVFLKLVSGQDRCRRSAARALREPGNSYAALAESAKTVAIWLSRSARCSSHRPRWSRPASPA